MWVHYLKAKIHRATLTGSNLHYEGSVSIGPEILEASGIRPFEKVDVYNINNGERFTTYAIEGSHGCICLNGAAAWKGKVGDLVIIAAYCMLEESKVSNFQPTLVYLSADNSIQSVKNKKN
ncbi:MAG: aspartate 1-decarboxylase [Deltaproteobacteria bacterium]|nr:aspartate 1-decarboxylase [Deltaproteobacteria bacterium]